MTDFTQGTLVGGDLRSFSPLSLNAQMWITAKDLTTITKDSSNKISQINDKSPNGYHMTQAAGAFQPPLVEASLNGRRSIYFAGSTTLTYLARNMAGTFISNPTLSGAMSIFFVFNNGINPGTRGICDSGYGSGRTGFMIGLLSTQTYVQLYTATNAWQAPSVWTVGANTILSIVWNNSTLKVWNNGTLAANVFPIANTGTDTRTDFSLGTFSIPGLYADFHFGEMAIFNTALSDRNRLLMEQYLKREWGI